MKPPALLLAASILANVVLCAVLINRAPDEDSAVQIPQAVAPGATASAPVGAQGDGDAATTHVEASSPASQAQGQVWARLRDDDLTVFAQNLRNAGLPEHVIAAAISAEARERNRVREPNPPATAAMASGMATRTDTLMAGSSPGIPVVAGLSSPTDPFGRNLEFIDPARRDQARTISRDYDALIADIKRGGGVLLTDSEKQMIATLEAERRRDLEGLLTPQELADYEIVKSPLFMRLANETQEFKPTTEEFRTLFALEKEYADRFGGGTGSSGFVQPRAQDRAAAAQFLTSIDDKMLLVLGTERFAAYDRARNFEYRELSKLTRRVNIPTEVAVEVFSMRDYVSAESNRIYSDSTLSTDQKRAALQSLAVGTRDQIRQQLGHEAGTAYLQIADRWLTQVEQGSAVTFTTRNSSSYRRVYPTPPPRPDGG